MTDALDRTDVHLSGRNNPALLKLVAAIREFYGARVERIVLFGSRARGDAEDDSDYDVAVFLHGLRNIDDRQREIGHLWDVTRAMLQPNDPVIELIVLRAGTWADRTEFMANLRREGIDL